MAVNYKIKYIDLRAKLVESVDVAYRLGYEKGMSEGQMAAQQQAMEQQMAAQQSMMGGGQPMEIGGPGMVDENGMPAEGGGEEMPMDGDEQEAAAMMEDEQAGSELDQHINELESLVQKGEKPKVTDIRKVVDSISTLRKNYKERTKKHNKKIISAQKQFVDKILKSWEKEEKDSNEDLEEAIKQYGFKID